MTAISLTEMLDERRFLLDLATGMLGSVSAAERAVQETYGRWYAFPGRETADPRPWLASVAKDICLDMLLASGTPSTRPAHDDVVRRFANACETGDIAALRNLLSADCRVVADGGGKVRAPLHPVRGQDAAARFLSTLLSAQPGLAIAVGSVNGHAALLISQAGRTVAAVTVTVTARKIAEVWVVLNPDKLRYH
jgi:RNA polymerase sigma-70 factor, ECF subfamily